MAKSPVRIVITREGGKGDKAKGGRFDATVISCHGRKFWRCKNEKGETFHVALDAATAVKRSK